MATRTPPSRLLHGLVHGHEHGERLPDAPSTTVDADLREGFFDRGSCDEEGTRG